MPITDVRRKEYSMGLSSNARLLSITARLTSNEYESQQVSNAKMRLATKSQEASERYLEALSETNYSYMTFDAQGNALNVPLTAAVLYQYGNSKNQYILSNAAGQALISREDKYHYDNAATLREFLESYGLNANFRTQTLKENYEYLNSNSSDPAIGGRAALEQWQNLMDSYKANAAYSTDAWAKEYTESKEVYNAALENYNKAIQELSEGKSTFTGIHIDTSTTPYTIPLNNDEKMIEIFTTEPKADLEDNGVIFNDTDPNSNTVYHKIDIDTILEELTEILNTAKERYSNAVTYDAYIENIIRSDSANSTACDNYDNYLEHLNNFNIEMEELGINMNEVYSYDDTTKARWYTNLWYRINGDSTSKSTNPNCAELDNKLLTSTSWIKDALAHGDISIEIGTYTQSENLTVDSTKPTVEALKGISWKTKIFSSCPDITRSDNDKAIETAEAEYQKALSEINIKDERYQRKLNTLDSEHNALQTEYESVKSALSKNIERSFKAFQG